MENAVFEVTLFFWGGSLDKHSVLALFFSALAVGIRILAECGLLPPAGKGVAVLVAGVGASKAVLLSKHAFAREWLEIRQRIAQWLFALPAGALFSAGSMAVMFKLGNPVLPHAELVNVCHLLAAEACGVCAVWAARRLGGFHARGL